VRPRDSEGRQAIAVRLTETAINKALRDAQASGARRDLSDAGQEGLRLRLTGTGAATRALACRDPQGRMRRFPRGGWPAVAISDAREKAREMRVKVRGGADPIADARTLRAIGRDAKIGVGTLAALLDLYGGPLPKKGPEPTVDAIRVIGPGAALKAWPDARKRVEGVFAKLLKQPLAVLNAGEFQVAADAHPSTTSASAAFSACAVARPPPGAAGLPSAAPRRR
jgi:hypothetical protein